MENDTMEIRKTLPLLALLATGFLLSSCTVPQERAQVIVTPPQAQEPQNSSVAKRFQESAPRAPTAVESAIELSEKYAKLSEQASVLRQENQDVGTKNQQFKERLAALEAQLQQAQKELGEANSFLIEMRIELNNWKSDVLGFRDEMRDAEKAQLEALLKILQVLGGEVNAGLAQENSTSPNIASASENEAGSSQNQQTSNTGGSND
jgi:chromosome segregation ATPase